MDWVLIFRKHGKYLEYSEAGMPSRISHWIICCRYGVCRMHSVDTPFLLRRHLNPWWCEGHQDILPVSLALRHVRLRTW